MSTRYGDGNDFECIPSASQAISGTTPIVSKVVDMRDMDCISYQLITDDVEDVIPVEEGDSADQATDTLAFAGFDFTGLEGATIRIEGSEDNDGDHVITTGGDGTAVCSASSLVDELFDPETVTATLIHTEDPVQGAWTIEVSNNYQAGGIAAYGQVETSGDWTDVTDAFSPAIAAVATAGSQFVQANLRCRSIRVTFTPTDGTGSARANTNAKGWS